jgi:nucleoside-diphosphate-sugar epimerase
LHDLNIVCLVHRTPVDDSRVTSVRGDVRQPKLGLAQSDYAYLAEQVDSVIHCAAVTDFNRTDGSLEATNIAGTEQVLAFASEADATMYHVSTAFVHTEATGERGRTAVGYASSKSAAEQLVSSSGVRRVILRPSVVIGDSESGQISAFQGLHQVAAGVFAGMVPMIPFDPSWPIDFVGCDVVADAIATVVEQGVQEGEFWITAGQQALRLDEAMAVCLELARDLDIAVDPPRFVPPELFDRLIGPVFLEALPTRIKTTVVRMLEFFTTYLQSGATMPSSLDELSALGAMRLPDQRFALRNSLQFWAEEKGYAGPDAARRVA